MLSLRFYLTCDQVCAVIQVTNKGFYVRGGESILLMLEVPDLAEETHL